MAKFNNENESNGINIIGSGTEIKGDISSNSDIRIDGSLIGNLTTSGKLVIGESGNIQGQVNCKNADVEGKVEGKITATDLLSLKSTAKIYGDININRLAVDPGCIFTGNCKMENNKYANVGFNKSKDQEYETIKTKVG